MDIQTKDGIVLRGVPDGTPDDVIKARIQKIRAERQAPAAAPEPPARREFSAPVEAAGAVVEPVLSLATGMLAKPAGDIAGLAKGSYDAIRRKLGYGQQGPDAEEARRAVQGSLQYVPRTEAGASESNPLNAVPAMIGEAIGAIQPDAVTGEESTTAGGMAQNALREAIPHAIGIAGVKYGPKMVDATGQAAKRGAESLMVRAIDPTMKQELTGQAQFAAKELLRRNLSPNTKGVDTVMRGIDDMNARVAAEIDASTASVPKQGALSALAPVRERFAYRPNLDANQASIGMVAEELVNHPRLPGDAIPVQEAQKLKLGYQRAARPAYGEEATAAQEAYKGVARALREGIETAHPNVGPWNAEASTLHRVLNVIDRSAAANAKGTIAPYVGTIGGVPYRMALALNRSAKLKSGLAHGLDWVGDLLSKKPAPVVPAADAPIPFERVPTPDPARPLSLAPEAEGLDYAAFARDYRAQKAMEAARPDTLIAREQAANTARQTAAERIADQVSQAERIPASGGMPYDLDPITGRLQTADRGLKGATPDTMVNTGSSLASAAEKMSGGRAFAMSAEERAAWRSTRVELEKAAPETRGLSDAAIAEKMADRKWAEKRIQELRTEYADWAKDAGARFREKQTSDLNDRANSKRLLTDAERKVQKSANSEAARRLQLTHEVRGREIQTKIDALERMTDALSKNRAGAGPAGSPGPKTRARMAEILMEARR